LASEEPTHASFIWGEKSSAFGEHNTKILRFLSFFHFPVPGFWHWLGLSLQHETNFHPDFLERISKKGCKFAFTIIPIGINLHKTNGQRQNKLLCSYLSFGRLAGTA
jgi:hypothetical protein